jgi:hypothetical protein
MKNGLFLLNPAWYALPLVIFWLVFTRNAALVDRIWLVNELAEWLARNGHRVATAPGFAKTVVQVSFEFKVRALSLLMLPFSIIGIFIVLWRLRVDFAENFLSKKMTPPAATEVLAILIFFVGGYVHYFLDPGAQCVLCPRSDDMWHAGIEAAALFVFSLAVFIFSINIYSRLYIFAINHNARRES